VADGSGIAAGIQNGITVGKLDEYEEADMKKRRYLLLFMTIAALVCLLLIGGCGSIAADETRLDSAPDSAVADAPEQGGQSNESTTGAVEAADSKGYVDADDVEEVAVDVPDVGDEQYDKYLKGLEGEDGQQNLPGAGDDKKSAGGKSAGDKSDSDTNDGDKSGDDKKSVKDRYQTDPVPKDKPTPQEPQDQAVDKKKSRTCTLLIECSTILDNIGKFDEAKVSILPEDGIVYAKREVPFYEGESVFDVLLRETKNSKIHMEFTNTPAYNSAYIEGIANLYEFDTGNLSGWMYAVNEWYPNYGCSRYQLKDGDAVAWRYTCDLGRDLGVDWVG
jgi:hypothetical protein